MRKATIGTLVCVCLATSGCIFGGGGGEPTVNNGGGADGGNNGGVDATTDANPNNATDAGNNGADAANNGADAANNGTNNAETCGDEALQGHETCDPSLPDTSAGFCPTECDDNNACTTDTFVGAAETCDLACQSTAIETCQNNDGCCPGDCSATNDSDCDETVVCGDGVVGGAETCDPGIAAGGEGACPASPDDCMPSSCQQPRIFGSAQNCDAECAFVPITQCMSGDGCCAPGCDESNDDDCASACGNGTIEPGETCDGNCPTACDDGDACTTETLSGDASTCDAECSSAPVTACNSGDGCCPSGCDSSNDNDCSASCGDGILDTGETCDPIADCPTDCDDGSECTADSMSGSAANCNVVCTNTPITACKVVSDGCCPAGCNANTDADCVAACGNGVVEGSEICDGNCPMSCDDGDACTSDTQMGEVATCDLSCSSSAITSCADGDGCCPAGCNSVSDDDCGAVCGNGLVEGNETCDGNCQSSCNDGNSCTVDQRFGSSSSCNVTCNYTNITSCIDGDGCCPAACNSTNDDDCSASCGNGIVEGNELCDGNCPTANDCNACETFSGSSASCNAQCTATGGCTPCDEACDCPSDGDLCIDGKCQQGTGSDCGRACDKGLYCDYFDPSLFCNTNETSCVQCEVNGNQANCTAIQKCAMGQCVPALSCAEAKGPDAWCALANGGDTDYKCDGNVCRHTCTTAADCPSDWQGCNTSGFCQLAPNCTEAKQPAAWCVADTGDASARCAHFVNGTGNCTNYESCDKNNPVCNFAWEFCVGDGGGGHVCAKPQSCGNANDGDSWCEHFDAAGNLTCMENNCK